MFFGFVLKVEFCWEAGSMISVKHFITGFVYSVMSGLLNHFLRLSSYHSDLIRPPGPNVPEVCRTAQSLQQYPKLTINFLESSIEVMKRFNHVVTVFQSILAVSQTE